MSAHRYHYTMIERNPITVTLLLSIVLDEHKYAGGIDPFCRPSLCFIEEGGIAHGAHPHGAVS